MSILGPHRSGCQAKRLPVVEHGGVPERPEQPWRSDSGSRQKGSRKKKKARSRRDPSASVDDLDIPDGRLRAGGPSDLFSSASLSLSLRARRGRQLRAT